MRIVKERRATIRQAAVPIPQPPVLPLTNLALAGDWIGSLPATIESAVIAGEQAIAPFRHIHGIHPSMSRIYPARPEDAA